MSGTVTIDINDYEQLRAFAMAVGKLIQITKYRGAVTIRFNEENEWLHLSLDEDTYATAEEFNEAVYSLWGVA